jgi:site-specific DNA-methyltransferase (adenine-specific)
MVMNVGKTVFESQRDDFQLLMGDALQLLGDFPDESVDMVFADPPYFLSNGGITCRSGRRTQVDKGGWDRSEGVEADFRFQAAWLSQCRRILKPNGTIWVSGTRHNIFSVGFAMQRLGYKLLNDIVWFKKNPPPNLSCRYFTHATETILWAARSEKSRHCFNYKLMKKANLDKQMQSLWTILPPRASEKHFGRHPTQKPIELLERIVLASTQPGDLVLDPFSGSGTTGIAAARHGRRYIGIELNPGYLELSVQRYIAETHTQITAEVSDVERPPVASGLEPLPLYLAPQ